MLGTSESRRRARSTIAHRALGRLHTADRCEGCGAARAVAGKLKVMVVVGENVEVDPDREIRVLALCRACSRSALHAVGVKP
jgi:ribosomal protein S14